jgi:hypothetical protein
MAGNQAENAANPDTKARDVWSALLAEPAKVAPSLPVNSPAIGDRVGVAGSRRPWSNRPKNPSEQQPPAPSQAE